MGKTRSMAVEAKPALDQATYSDGVALRASGPWTARNAPSLEQLVLVAEKLAVGKGRVLIDVSRVSNLDTFGAWFIERLRRNFTKPGLEPRVMGLSDNYATLYEEGRNVQEPTPPPAVRMTPMVMLERIGCDMSGAGDVVVALPAVF